MLRSQRRTNRRIKELTFSQEEDRKNHEVNLDMEMYIANFVLFDKSHEVNLDLKLFDKCIRCL